jgi:pilus assembly protein CpaD
MTTNPMRKTAPMAALPDLPRTLSAYVLGLSLAAVAVSALTGCGVDYASSDPAFPGDFQARHPIVLATAPTTLEVYPVGGALDTRTRADLRAFAEHYRRFGSGEIVIFTPGGKGSNAKAVNEIRKALASVGLKGAVGVGSYAPADLDRAAPIRVAFRGLKAEVKTPCGLWPDDLASGSSLTGWKNEPYANYGCATQAMMAAQVDDPRDFAQSRALGPSDVQMRTRAIEAVRNGKDPGTTWSIGLTPIGTVGGQ